MTRMLFVRLSVIRLLPVLQITFQQTDNYLFFFFRPAGKTLAVIIAALFLLLLFV